MATRIVLDVSVGLYDEFDELRNVIESVARENDSFVTVEYFHGCGGPPLVPSTEFLSVVLEYGQELAKDVLKMLAGAIAKALIDYYSKKPDAPPTVKREMFIYDPTGRVLKSFTVEGDGRETRVTDEREDFEPHGDTFS